MGEQSRKKRKPRRRGVPYSRRAAARRSMAIHSGRHEPAKRSAGTKTGHGHLWQLIVCAAVLITVVAVKLTAPTALETCRQQLLELVGEDRDFVEAFSAVGRAMGSGDGLGQALNDACTAVFGTQPVTEDAKTPTVYTEENLPDHVNLFQEVLPFSYAPPLQGTREDGFGWREHPIEGGSRFHYGVDLAADTGTEIGSFADGTVTAVGKSAALGNYVTVLHAGDYTTLYAHCSRITVSAGQKVRQGDPIAEVGETGQATGPHLHFELCRGEVYLNPIYYV